MEHAEDGHPTQWFHPQLLVVTVAVTELWATAQALRFSCGKRRRVQQPIVQASRIAQCISMLSRTAPAVSEEVELRGASKGV